MVASSLASGPQAKMWLTVLGHCMPYPETSGHGLYWLQHGSMVENGGYLGVELFHHICLGSSNLRVTLVVE
jgi:hypothetical protein